MCYSPAYANASFALLCFLIPDCSDFMQPADIADIIRSTQKRVRVLGAGTKPGLHLPDGDQVTSGSMADVAGITEYDPSEYTVTTLAGTRLSDLTSVLASRGQYLPFDPMFEEAGTTVGGTVASNASGPGRFRYGGVRDFVIGVQFVDGRGRLVRGGGKVVKNAAGFDFPKLLTGSAGRLGVITELTFKVFPRPVAYLTAQTACADLQEAMRVSEKLRTKPFDVDAVEVDPPGKITLRIGGDPTALVQRMQRIRNEIGANFDVLDEVEALTFWTSRREFKPVPGGWRLRIPCAPHDVLALSGTLSAVGARHYFSSGGNVAFAVWPTEVSLHQLGRPFQNLDGPNMALKNPFYRAVQSAVDPEGRFAEPAP